MASFNTFTSELTGEVKTWLEFQLVDLQGEADATLVDYILTMVVNKKSSTEMAADLVDFLGEDDCKTLLDKYELFIDISSSFLFSTLS
jgi:hypothetical protein